MSRADAFGLLLAFIARLLTGAQGHWKGCPPKAEQRSYFAKHQSHLDWVLIWAALPRELRASTRPIAARDDWTATPFRHGINREVFNAVYVSRQRADNQDPLEPLVEALQNGDSLLIFPEGTRNNKGLPQPLKSGLYSLAEQFPQLPLIPAWVRAARAQFEARPALAAIPARTARGVASRSLRLHEPSPKPRCAYDHSGHPPCACSA